MAKLKKIKAEKEIKEKEELELEDKKDLDKKEIKEEIEEKDNSEKDVEESVEDTEKDAETESEDLIVLDSGATVDENAEVSADEISTLAKITKEDGTEIFVEKIEDVNEDEKKEVYEAILEADKPLDPAEEISEEVLEEVNDEPLMEEDIEEVNYIPAACDTREACLDNSFYIVKLKSGKIRAFKAGRILNASLKKIILKNIKAGKELPSATSIFNKIANKIGYTFGAFQKLATKLATVPNVGDVVKINNNDVKITANKDGVITLENGKKIATKHLMAAEIEDNIPGAVNEDAEALKDFSISDKDIEKSKLDSEIALDDKDFKAAEGEGVKPTSSKVKSYFGRLPSKSEVGDEVEWALKDFNKEHNKREKTMAAQIKSLRDATKEIRSQKEIIASKEAEIKALQEKLNAVAKKEETMIKSAKINKIIASMNIEDAEEKVAMTNKFASYSKDQLNAVYETLTACPTEEATIMHERMINEEMKKEASELAGFAPAVKLEEKTSSIDDMEKLVLEKEQEFQSQNYKGN